MRISRILVCMKAVQTAEPVRTEGQVQTERDKADLQWNIADESALEAAFRLVDGTGRVTVLTMGPPKLKDLLKEVVARGVEEPVLITDRLMAGADTHATAAALKAAVEKLGPYDLILCGRRAIDGETGQVPGELAAALGIPCISEVESVEQMDGNLILTRRMGEGAKRLLAKLPLVISLCEYTYPLRLANLMGIRRARETQIIVYGAKDLGLSPGDCGKIGSLTEVMSTERQFPGLRHGSRQTDLQAGVARLLEMIAEVRE